MAELWELSTKASYVPSLDKLLLVPGIHDVIVVKILQSIIDASLLSFLFIISEGLRSLASVIILIDVVSMFRCMVAAAN